MSPEAREKQIINFLPLSPEAVTQGLASIALDPDKVDEEESTLMALKNPELNLNIYSVGSTLSKNETYSVRSFVEGATFMHRILRIQADIVGSTIPVLTREEADVYLLDEVDRLSDSNRSMENDFVVEYERIGSEDGQFKAAVEEMTKFRTHKPDFYGGATLVYKFVKKGLEKIALQRTFGGS